MIGALLVAWVGLRTHDAINRHRGAPRRVEVRSLAVGNTTLVLNWDYAQSHTWHSLQVFDRGHEYQAGLFNSRIEAETAILQWQRYLEHGGTVEAWLRRYGVRQQQLAAAMRQPR